MVLDTNRSPRPAGKVTSPSPGLKGWFCETSKFVFHAKPVEKLKNPREKHLLKDGVCVYICMDHMFYEKTGHSCSLDHLYVSEIMGLPRIDVMVTWTYTVCMIMFMCMHLCVYVCVYIYVYIYICIYTHT